MIKKLDEKIAKIGELIEDEEKVVEAPVPVVEEKVAVTPVPLEVHVEEEKPVSVEDEKPADQPIVISYGIGGK